MARRLYKKCQGRSHECRRRRRRETRRRPPNSGGDCASLMEDSEVGIGFTGARSIQEVSRLISNGTAATTYDTRNRYKMTSTDGAPKIVPSTCICSR
jgi:hypothetical protein